MKPILATLFILFFSIQLSATEKKDTIRVLFIGNSYIYYNNLAQMISLISDSLDTKLICTKSTIGSATLGEHWNGLRGLKSKELITKNKYQVVVIQDNSMYPIEHKDSVLYYGSKFCSLIKSTGAKPFLYNTWARKKTPETQAQINEVYKILATEQDATSVLVGDSWALAMQMKPDIELFHFDGSHPSYPGTF